jgi:hypothetical protein
LLSRGGFGLAFILKRTSSSPSFWDVSMMVTAKMLYKMVLTSESTLRSIRVSLTAIGVAVPNLGSVCMMDTLPVAGEVSFALERSTTNATFDNFHADMRLFASALGRPERHN